MIDKFVIVYKDTPTFKDGSLCKIIDRDPHDDSFAVVPLEDIFKYNGDMSILIERSVKWVKFENMEILSFDKPNGLVVLWRKIKRKISLILKQKAKLFQHSEN